jgi:hypothetical protein
MAKVILNHRVKDYDTWKVGYDSDAARRDSAGLIEIAVGKKAGDPNLVYVIWEAPDPSVFDTMFADPELQQAMESFGVISAPEMIIIE